MKKMVKIGFFAHSMLDAGPTMAILFAVPLKFGIYDSGFGIYWLWVLSSSILVIYIAKNGQNSEKMVKMLVQGHDPVIFQYFLPQNRIPWVKKRNICS